VAALAVMTTVLTACGGSTDHGTSTTSAQATTGSAAAPSGEHNDADIAFAQGMIPHHEGAIDMSNALLGSGRNADAEKLAGEITSAQQAEITEMEGLLKTVG
jgi:uncharacterized protein (DUF305 family)